jgi:integrase
MTLTKEFENAKSIHAMRRTLNSNLKCNGVSTTVAAALLGHTERVNEENYTYDVSSISEKRQMIEMAGKIS